MNHEKLTKLRESYAGFNDLPIVERLRRSNPIENWIRDTMNFHGVPWGGELVRGWEQCSATDDRKLKRDAQTTFQSNLIYAQIKFRQPDSGTDVGCAILQPYPGSRRAIKQIAQGGKDEMIKIFARDYKFDGIIYAVLDNTWTKLMLLPFQECVKPNYTRLLKEWWTDPESSELNNYNRVFRSKEMPKAELRWKKDSGKRGYDSGVEKILCYLPISIFTGDSRVTVVDMIDLPDYLFGV